MKSYQIAAILMVVASLAGGIALMPHDRELALMYLKDKDYETAREYYEKLIADNDFSISVVAPLTQLYLSFGDVDAAVALMERFVREHPENTEARERLGKYLQYAQRSEEFQINLEELVEMAPSQERLMELSNIYNFNAQFDRQIVVLKRVVELYPENPQNFLNLAQLQASRNLYDDTLATLTALKKHHPGKLDAAVVEFMVSLHLDTGKPEAAVEEAVGWLNADPEPEVIVKLASLVHFRGYPAAALAILTPYADQSEESPELLQELTLVEIANGKLDQAWERLLALFENDDLPDLLYEQFIDLALAKQNLHLAMAGLRKTNPANLPPDLLSQLGEVAFEQGEISFVEELGTVLGEIFFNANPILAANLSLALDDLPKAVYWVSMAERDEDLSLHQKLRLAVVYTKINRDADALTLLATLADNPNTPDAALLDLALLYVKLKKADTGLKRFEILKSVRAESRPVEEGWLFLAAAAGKDDRVIDWFHAQGEAVIRPAFVKDLYYTAFDNRADVLALHLAERLHAKERTPQVRLMLANALFRFKSRKEEVLPIARSLMPGGPDVEGLYLTALLEARKKDPAIKGELGRFLERKLAQSTLAQKERENYVYILSTQVGSEPALPHLKKLAEEQGGDWSFAYEAALRDLGDKETLMAFWKKRLASGKLTLQERRNIGFNFISEKEKGEAVEIYRSLADKAEAKSPDVNQFLFLLGPRPGNKTLSWMESRARKAQGIERASWITHLTNAGGLRRSVQLLKKNPPILTDDPVLRDVYLDNLSLAKEKAALGEALDWEIPVETDPKRLRHMAALAEGQGLNQRAILAYKAVLKVKPDDLNALKRIGFVSYFEADRKGVERFLGRYIRLTGGDWESRFYLAETLWFEKKKVTARGHFEAALHFLERKPKPLPHTLEVNRARILTRMNRTAEAIAAYEAMLKKRPEDKALQGDYAELLLTEKRYERLRRFLAQRDAAAWSAAR